MEVALRERAERLERELAVERAARLVQEQRAGRCLEPRRGPDREQEGGKSTEGDIAHARLNQSPIDSVDEDGRIVPGG